MALVLNAAALGWLYPAHIVTDASLTLRSFGPSIARAFPDVAAGAPLFDHFAVERPLGRFDVARLLREREQVWLRGAHGMKLRGIVVDQDDALFFLLNYAPSTLRSDTPYQLQMWDFSPADAALDALIAVEMQKALIAETQDALGELTAAKASAGVLARTASPSPDPQPEDAHGTPEGPPAFSPLEVVDQVCDEASPQFRARGVTLQAEVDAAGDLRFEGAAAALAQAVRAMLSHALRRSAQGWVRLNASAHMDGARLQLRVDCLDAGPLEPPDGVSEPDPALVLASEAMAVAGGRLERRVLAGVGVRTELRVAYRPARSAGQALTPFRLLVVSNNSADRRLIEATLVPPAVEVVVAETEVAAKAAIAGERFDLVLADVQSAGFDVLSLAAVIRGDRGRGAATPLVVIGQASVIAHLDEDASRRADLVAARPLSPSRLLGLTREAAGYST